MMNALAGRCLCAVIVMIAAGSIFSHALEAQTLTLDILATSISENAGTNATTATVTRSGDVTNTLLVTLTNSDLTEVSVPLTVTILSNQVSAAFTIASVNDGDIDGLQSVSITATATNFTSGTDSVQVTDDDTAGTRTLGGALTGTVVSATYRVTYDINVAAGQTLTIQPTSTLQFESNIALNVAGTLIADADAGTEVIFTTAAASPAPGRWKGITLVNEGGPRSILDHTQISYARAGLQIVFVANPQVTLSASEVSNCELIGVAVDAGRNDFISATEVQLLGNRIFSNGVHGVALSSSTANCDASENAALVSGNEIFANAIGVYLNASRSGLDCTFGSSSGVRSEISRNYIHHNGVGLQSSSSSGFNARIIGPTIINNVIVSNSNAGLSLFTSSETLIPMVLNNTVANNGGPGIIHDEFTSVGFVIRNNIVVSNALGIVADATFSNGTGVVVCNDVFGNAGGNWSNYPAAFGNLTTNNINGTPADAGFNIGVNPQFIGGSNYHLGVNSPCVNAGTNGSVFDVDFDGDPRVAGGRVDIGADELQPPPQLLVTPASLDFGGVNIGKTNSQQFQVMNIGGLTIAGSGSVAGPFAITTGSVFNVIAGQTGLVTVSFTPISPGLVSNRVIFTSNGGNSTNPVTGLAQVPIVDLVELAVIGPTNASNGALIFITNSVRNAGTITSGFFNVGIYLSTDSTIATNDLRLGNYNVNSLPPGSTNTFSNGYPIPSSVAPGPYFIGVIADYLSLIAELDESNNALAGNAVNIQVGADFAMTQIAGPTNAVPGTSILVTNAVQNIGTGFSTEADLRVGLYLSVDSFITTNDLLIRSRVMTGSTIAPGQTNSAVTTVIISNSVSAGTYFLGAIADYLGHLVEFSETNNALTGNAITVTGPPGPPVASFIGSPTNGPIPLSVIFTDTSTGTITNRFWSFGDGFIATTTTVTNFVYPYTWRPPGDVSKDTKVSGSDSLLINQVVVGLRSTNDLVFRTNLTVRLIVQGPAGTSTNAKPGYIGLGIFPNGDVNQTNKVTGADSLLVNQVIVGLRAYMVTSIEPSSRSNSVPTSVTIYGIGFPTNSVPTITIGSPVDLTLTNVVVVNREQITALVPPGGRLGTGTVNVISSPTNGVISFGRFINQ